MCSDGENATHCLQLESLALTKRQVLLTCNENDGHKTPAPLGDDPEMGFIGSTNYVPHVLKCEFCPTNKENVLASFDHLHKCEVDKHLKNGILTHKAGPIADEG